MGRRKNIGRVLAGILAVGLLVSSMPSAVYATEDESGTAVVAEQETAVPEETGEEAGQESAETEPVGKEDSESEEKTVDTADTTPEEEDKENQEDIDEDSEQTEEDNEAGDTETAEEEAVPDEEDELETDAESQASVFGTYSESVKERLAAMSAEGDIASGVVDNSFGKIVWVIDKNGKLTVEGTGDCCFINMPPWWNWRSSIVSAEIRVKDMTSAYGMFSGCNNLVSVDLSRLDTSKIGDMRNMFINCSSLINLDISGFDTGNVLDMGNMFDNCNSLTSLDTSRFDTGKVTCMDRMFNGCSKLTNLDVSHFDTGNVEDMSYMFNGCSSLVSLDVSRFDTSKVESMFAMFSGCNNLISLDVSNFDTANVTMIASMFSDCSSLTNLDVSHFDTGNVTTDYDRPGNSVYNGMRNMFNGCSSLISLDVSNFNISKIVDMSYMFNGCSNLTSLDVSGFNTSNVRDMRSMFDGCSNLTSLDVSGFNTSSVTSMGDMFNGCSSLTSLNVSSFTTSKVTYMSYMFNDCSGLTGLNVSGLNTSKVTDMRYMFSGCSNLTRLDLSHFNTSNVANMSCMFSGCSSLSSLDVSNFNTSNVTDMGSMFSDCSGLSSLNINSFDTSNVTSMSHMFRECSSLTSLNLSSFNMSNAAIDDMLVGCYSLSTIYAPCWLKRSVSLPTYWDSTFKEEWRLSDGTVVTELPRNLTRSVELRKYRIAEQSPDEGSADDQLKYVQNLTQTSLKNADAESRKSIQNAIYNLLFKAEYRPMCSRIPGDTMVYTGSRDVISRWPIQNKDYRTAISKRSTVTDSQLGTINYNFDCAGCMSYACFATTYVYGTSGTMREGVTPNAESVRNFIRSYADPGEQLRYNRPHSIVFLGEDADGDGFYYISYDGGDDGAGHVYHDLYVGSYASYADFAAKIAGCGGKLYIFDTNNGSYYNNTAVSAADVRNGKGAARIVTRLACPIEATVELNGEILDSRNPGTASFGTVVRDGEEVVFTLDYSSDYRLTVNGTGEGGMTLTLEYYDEGETLIDRRKFVDMPIKVETEIESGGFDPQASFVLHKSDNDGEAEAWARA